MSSLAFHPFVCCTIQLMVVGPLGERMRLAQCLVEEEVSVSL